MAEESQTQLDGFGNEDSASVVKPCILLMGMKRSGKSSIMKVVFYKMSPHETQFLESTHSIEKSDIANSSFVQFQVWDFPGQIDFTSSDVDVASVFGPCDAIVFVLDSQQNEEDQAAALARLVHTARTASQVNKKIRFEVFIHKSDGLADTAKFEMRSALQKRAGEELEEANLSHINMSYHMTSIYDHSVFEAFSKVVQKLIPQLPTLEFLHDSLNSSSRMDKSFLFDVVSKIYISTDATPVDMVLYELCSDMIDVTIDVSCIYGMGPEGQGLAYDGRSAAVIRVSNGTVVYLRQVNRYLAVVCIMKEEAMERKGLIDYNIQCFKDAVGKVFSGPASQEPPVMQTQQM